MDSVTRQNAALVEQSSAASASFEEQARRLTEIVSVFRLYAAPAEEMSRNRQHSQATAERNSTPVTVVSLPVRMTADNWETSRHPSQRAGYV